MEKIGKPFIIFILTILLSFCSSTSSNYRYIADKNNPSDQNATIIFQNIYQNHGGYSNNGLEKGELSTYYKLTKWNEISIEKYFFNSPGKVLIVPAGDNIITFNVSKDYDGNTYTFNNVKLQYDFEPEKRYEIKSTMNFAVNDSLFTSSGYQYDIELHIRLYDTTNGTIQPVLLKQWKVTRLWFLNKNFYYQ